MEFESTVRGYHVYKRTWTPVIGESLTAAREFGNIHAVALFSGGVKIGHIPMKMSRLCSSFITRGGTIEVVITGSRQFAAHSRSTSRRARHPMQIYFFWKKETCAKTVT